MVTPVPSWPRERGRRPARARVGRDLGHRRLLGRARLAARADDPGDRDLAGGRVRGAARGGRRARRRRSTGARSRSGSLAGLGGGAGLAAFYKALSLGTMSIVSPVVACGAVVPFAISIATGERPCGGRARGRRARARRGGARVGRGAPRGGAEPRAGGRARGRRGGRARPLHLLPRAREPRGQRALDAHRRARRLARPAPAARRRRGASRCGSGAAGSLPIAAIGLCDVAANALFALASRHGLLSLVSVLGSLYPVMTIVLAYVVLHERLTRIQLARRRDGARRRRRAERRVVHASGGGVARRQAPDLLAVARRPELPAHGRADDPPRRGGRGRARALAAVGAADRRRGARPRRPAVRRRGRLRRRARCSRRRSSCSSSSTSRATTPTPIVGSVAYMPPGVDP